jgi:Zn-dependent M16 (insulinase) family peptidase
MDQAALEAVAREQRRLQERQETPDPPEALATLPSLALADLDRRSPTIPLAVSPADGGETIVYHDLWTSGILYLDLGFDLHRAPADLLFYAGLLGRALVQIGTISEDFVRLTQRINQKTGGIRPQVWTGFVPDRAEAAARLFLRAKAMPDQSGELLALLRDLLLTVRLDNRERFHQMALEEKARLEARLIPAGSGFVAGRLFAHFHEAAWASEQMGGFAYLFFLRDLVERVENDWSGVLADLERLRELLLSRNALVVNATMDAENWARFEPGLREFLAGLPAAPTAPALWQRGADALPPGEGMAIPAQVNYVGKAADLYALGLPRHGSALVASKYLRTTYLWQQVRVQGGAYGGSCQFEHRSGLFGLFSYRDPNLLQTLDVYDRAGEFLRHADISDHELTRTIIGVIGDLDHYQLPDARGFTSLLRWLSGETDAERQRRREDILGTTPSDLAAFAEALLRIKDSGVVAALGSPAALDAANAERPGLLRITKVL